MKMMKQVGETMPKSKKDGKDLMEHKEPKMVESKETEKHAGFYKGPHNQTLKAGHGERKEHEDHHPAVKMSKERG